MILPYLQWAITTIDSFWTNSWASYSTNSSAKAKLNAARAIVIRSLVLIEEANVSIRGLELNKRNVDTTLRNANSIIKDRDYHKEQTTWLQESLNKLKRELRIVSDERDKLSLMWPNFLRDAIMPFGLRS
ncbi:hypothetical protein Fot_02873 [Forsythia ovata]|uniref:Uncharacterized protein n=1 Tax=Forsythia ovata TaxID=205694 RepID=A0ABD1X834_9LAMI